MSWQKCDSSERLRLELQAFIKTWIKNVKYKSLIPRQHCYVVKQGDKQPAGVNVVIVTEKSTDSTWPYKEASGTDAGKMVLEENHQIALAVKSDKSNGGAEAVSAMQNTLKLIFSNLDESPERSDLINRGIYNLFDDPEGLQVDPGNDTEEGTFFLQQLNLKCSTDTIIG